MAIFAEVTENEHIIDRHLHIYIHLSIMTAEYEYDIIFCLSLYIPITHVSPSIRQRSFMLYMPCENLMTSFSCIPLPLSPRSD